MIFLAFIRFPLANATHGYIILYLRIIIIIRAHPCAVTQSFKAHAFIQKFILKHTIQCCWYHSSTIQLYYLTFNTAALHTHSLSHTHTHTHTLTLTLTHTHTIPHSHTHTHTFVFWFTGTLHRRNGFYTVQSVYSIALHQPYT